MSFGETEGDGGVPYSAVLHDPDRLFQEHNAAFLLPSARRKIPRRMGVSD